jgi:hypothetical protein
MRTKAERPELDPAAKEAISRFFWSRFTLPVLGLNLVVVIGGLIFILRGIDNYARAEVTSQVAEILADMGMVDQIQEQASNALVNLGSLHNDLDDVKSELDTIRQDATGALRNEIESVQSDVNSLLEAGASLSEVDAEGVMERLRSYNELLSDGDQFKILASLSGVPIGSIVAWHKSLGDSPSALAGTIWVECNGQKLTGDSYAESPFLNLEIPDLNRSGRFLRGSAESGIYQDDTFKSHSHEHYHHVATQGESDRDVSSRGSIALIGRQGSDSKYELSGLGTTPTLGITSPSSTRTGDAETRPKNMSVVWIMRVK